MLAARTLDGPRFDGGGPFGKVVNLGAGPGEKTKVHVLLIGSEMSVIPRFPRLSVVARCQRIGGGNQDRRGARTFSVAFARL